MSIDSGKTIEILLPLPNTYQILSIYINQNDITTDLRQKQIGESSHLLLSWVWKVFAKNVRHETVFTQFWFVL